MATSTLIGALLVPLAITVLVTPAIIRFARRCNCYDLPGKRRFHRIKTPRWGGVAFFLGVAPVLLSVWGTGRASLSFLFASLIIVLTGMIDDRKAMGWKWKMGAMAAATAVVVYGSGAVLRQLGTFGGPGVIELGIAAVPFTFFCVIGVTNAMNMVDGLNGLSSGIAILAFLLLGVAAAAAGNFPIALVCMSFAGALLGFLGYNFPRARIFMGDSGSMYLGFSLAVISTLLTQDDRFPVDPLFPVAVLFLPIADALRVMTVRLTRRKSPFLADKGHLHHLIVRNGVSSFRTVVALWGFMTFAGSAAFAVRGSAAALAVLVCSQALAISFIAKALVARIVGSRRRSASARAVTVVPLPLPLDLHGPFHAAGRAIGRARRADLSSGPAMVRRYGISRGKDMHLTAGLSETPVPGTRSEVLRSGKEQ
jgi:UDP-GlcNAc:undecaprenyl-phosphate GlcNAc-1-phosphate transferase